MLLVPRILRSFAAIAIVRGTLAFDSLDRLLEDAIPILFPPVRMSLHLCRLEREDAIELSKKMSSKRFIHEIHRELDGFAARMHDIWEHRDLYVLDLNCDYAIPLLRAANETGMLSAPLKWLLLRDRSSVDGDWTDERETLKGMAVYPDSEVIVARKRRNGVVEIRSVYRPSPFHEAIEEDRGNWTIEHGMTDPDTINHLTDYENKHIDPVTKANYPWIMHIANRMNATISFRVTDSWGYRSENGSWSGMTGMLQRREIDIGGTGTFFIPQRIGVVDYIQLYTHTRACFIFRQPLLSTVSNIFTLPFQRSVWIAIAVFLLLLLVLLCFSTKWEYRRGASANTARYWQQFNPAEQTVSDNLMVVLGAIAQQGYSYEPYRVPSRIVTLMLLIAALNLYASYTANIVALLQSTTDSIKTPADLLHSPLKLGAQDVVYSRHFFKSFQDPIRRAIVDQKIEPKGQNGSWMSVEEGARRVRNELFAFHAERGALYKIMQETYYEEEKCGIMEIDVMNMLDPLLVIQTRSPYLEIVKNAALLLRETGLKVREDIRLYTNKPKCHERKSFVRIGFTECYFALVALGYGTLLSLVVLAIEVVWHKKIQQIRWDRTSRNNDAMTIATWSKAVPFEFEFEEEDEHPMTREGIRSITRLDSMNKRVKRWTVKSVDNNSW